MDPRDGFEGTVDVFDDDPSVFHPDSAFVQGHPRPVLLESRFDQLKLCAVELEGIGPPREFDRMDPRMGDPGSFCNRETCILLAGALMTTDEDWSLWRARSQSHSEADDCESPAERCPSRGCGPCVEGTAHTLRNGDERHSSEASASAAPSLPGTELRSSPCSS